MNAMHILRCGWALALAGAVAAPAWSAGPTGTQGVSRAGGAAVVAPASASLSPLLRSRVVFSNFDKVPTAFQGGGFLVWGPLNPSGYGKQFVAVPVVVKEDVSLTGISLALSRDPGATGQPNVRVGLWTDNGGVPGELVQSWAVAAVAEYVQDNLNYVSVLPPRPGVALTAGTTYWVAVDTDSSSDFSGWWANNGSNAQGTIAYWNDAYASWKATTFTVPALAVYGQPR